MIELGRIEVATKFSMISLFLAYPRESHIVAAFHIIVYLNQKHNSSWFLKPTYIVINKTTFNYGADWKEFYGNTTKVINTDALEKRGKEVDIWMMFYSDHAGDRSTRRSQTGFMIYANMKLITYLYKKQRTIEISYLDLIL